MSLAYLLNQIIGVFSSGGNVIDARECHFESIVVMVSADISTDGRTEFHTILNETVTSQRYKDEIFRPIVAPYVSTIGEEGWILIVATSY